MSRAVVSKGPEFNSQQPHDGSHPSVLLQCTHIHKINKYILKKQNKKAGPELAKSVSF